MLPDGASQHNRIHHILDRGLLCSIDYPPRLRTILPACTACLIDKAGDRAAPYRTLFSLWTFRVLGNVHHTPTPTTVHAKQIATI
jgi:hypothetical protein